MLTIIEKWHQFAVINPLRFLGLLDPDKDPDKTRLKPELIDKFVENLPKKFGSQGWLDKTGLDPKIKDNCIIKANIAASQLKNCLIDKAENLKEKGKLKILKKFYKK